MILEKLRENVKELGGQFDAIKKKILVQPTTIEQMVEIKNYMSDNLN